MRIVHLGLKDGATKDQIVAALTAKGLKPYAYRNFNVDPTGKTIVKVVDQEWKQNLGSLPKGVALSKLEAVVDEFDEVVEWRH
jgi:hypothetical protein